MKEQEINPGLGNVKYVEKTVDGSTAIAQGMTAQQSTHYCIMQPTVNLRWKVNRLAGLEEVKEVAK